MSPKTGIIWVITTIFEGKTVKIKRKRLNKSSEAYKKGFNRETAIMVEMQYAPSEWHALRYAIAIAIAWKTKRMRSKARRYIKPTYQLVCFIC